MRAWRNSLLLGLSDAAVLVLALLAGRLLIYFLGGGPLTLRYSLLLIPVWWLGSAAVGLLPSWGLGSVEEMRRIQLLLLSVFALGGLAYFFGRGHFYPSRLAYGVAWALAAAGLPVARSILKWVLVRARAWGCPVVLYGSQSTVDAVAAAFLGHPEIGYRPIGVFSDDAPAGGQLAGLPVLGGADGFTRQAEVAVAPVSLAGERSFVEVFDRVLSGYRQVHLLPGTNEDLLLWGQPRTLGGIVSLEVTHNLLNPFARVVKRAMDLAIALLLLPLWLPLGLLIALAVWVSDGRSPFYRQERLGYRDRPFRPLKFRSMVPEAGAILEAALRANPAWKAEWEASQKLRHDPRVTRIGRILRRWSLDELPQLWNVVTGRMSLVGPRPLPADHFQALHESTRRLRAHVRPGITGLWQVSGRSAAGTAGMDRWDTYYVRNWSIWLDLVILMRTLRAVATGRGAY